MESQYQWLASNGYGPAVVNLATKKYEDNEISSEQYLQDLGEVLTDMIPCFQAYLFIARYYLKKKIIISCLYYYIQAEENQVTMAQHDVKGKGPCLTWNFALANNFQILLQYFSKHLILQLQFRQMIWAEFWSCLQN